MDYNTLFEKLQEHCDKTCQTNFFAAADLDDLINGLDHIVDPETWEVVE